ncbi:MAG: oxidoreductase [Actinobacteria bacterium HGW-Actinobacteria-7]|jgi:3-hydroxyisobutyrate dehydrogenase|nr:MAG: oxidoreductase [Actinobacteria bacterium HGW-Actinobacteria-7]
MQPEQTTIAFVGTGVMGAAMAGHLMDAGYSLRVFNRTKAKAEPLVARGATWADSPGQAAMGADLVITMVGFPADVEECYLGAEGIVETARDGAVLVDMTTSSPALAEKIAASAAARGLNVLDAPVSGGDVGARNATLTIMVGGDEAAFERVAPVFSVMGKSVTLHGGPGSGQHCKMANQIAIAATMLGMCECLSYAEGAGLDKARVIETLSGGSAQTWTLTNYGPRVLNGDFAPGFYVKHFVKDLRIALASADAMGREMPGLALAKRLYEALSDGGGSELGTQALWLLYARVSEREEAGVLGGVSVEVAARE